MIPTWCFFKNFLEFCSFIVHQITLKVRPKVLNCVISHVHFHQVQNTEYLSERRSLKFDSYNSLLILTSTCEVHLH